MKRIFSVLACVVLVFAMATVAMASIEVATDRNNNYVPLGEEIVLTVTVTDAEPADNGYITFGVPACFTIEEAVFSDALNAKNPSLSDINIAGGEAVFALGSLADLNGEVFKLVLSAYEKPEYPENVNIGVQLKNDATEVLNVSMNTPIGVYLPAIEGYSFEKNDYKYTYGDSIKPAKIVKKNATADVVEGEVEYYEGETLLGTEVPTTAGNYTAKATFTKENYAALVLTANFVINPKEVEIIDIEVYPAEIADGTITAVIAGAGYDNADIIDGDDVELIIGDAEFAEGAEVGEENLVNILEDTFVFGGADGANYKAVVKEKVYGEITMPAMVPTDDMTVDYDTFDVTVPTADGDVVINLNKANYIDGSFVDNGDGTYDIGFEGFTFDDSSDADKYADSIVVTVSADKVTEVIADSSIDKGVFVSGIGYFLKGMTIVLKIEVTEPKFSINGITLDGDTKKNGASFVLGDEDSYTVTAEFLRKQTGSVVYPAPGKNNTEEKSGKIVLTIGSTEATVFGTKKVNDVAPIIINDRTMLPARFVAEALGARVEWNDATKTVSIFKDMKKIEIVIGDANAYINGQAVALDSPAIIQNSRTYMPVRFIAESLGANVKWNEATRQVIITK